MSTLPVQPREFLPHREPMILLTEIIGFVGEEFGARVTIGADSLFQEPCGRVPAWVGVEYMAQTIAAAAGYSQRESGEAVRMGFLLGCRRCTMSVSAFHQGQKLEVWTTNEVDNVELGNYTCRIADAESGESLMTASITVFQPKDVDAFLEQHYRKEHD